MNAEPQDEPLPAHDSAAATLMDDNVKHWDHTAFEAMKDGANDTSDNSDDYWFDDYDEAIDTTVVPPWVYDTKILLVTPKVMDELYSMPPITRRDSAISSTRFKTNTIDSVRLMRLMSTNSNDAITNSHEYNDPTETYEIDEVHELHETTRI
ncbi:hypothetical protein CI109_104409 [Kwoniella shandongensis]|uniref:Uncharacterized protein n=1 Tax=Kwoniella shandongensis TaxID=1734106 RepID=A0A5M6C2A2_9TREE|nr:uncharacterized protein CI109_004192 [Kwoniella shandongensis]KAA5527379.1 hypothetical protein CI109_004192 [Kwoniella shandongensis]